MGNETISWGMWWVCWGPWSVRAPPKCKSKGKTGRFLSVQKVATHNGNPPGSRQGAAREPPTIRQGAHFWIQWPQGCSRKSRRNKKNSPGHGTRDDDRISHALGTRPGEFPMHANFALIFFSSKHKWALLSTELISLRDSRRGNSRPGDCQHEVENKKK